MLDLVETFRIKGIAHITGGGFYENIPRMGGDGLRYIIHRGSWPVLPIFETLMKLGHVDEIDMYNTFNMGIGMVFAVDARRRTPCSIISIQRANAAYRIGVVSDSLPEGGLCRGTLTVK